MKIAAALIVAFLIIGAMSFEDEQAEQANYCDMVKSGAWPNYKSVKCE